MLPTPASASESPLSAAAMKSCHAVLWSLRLKAAMAALVSAGRDGFGAGAAGADGAVGADGVVGASGAGGSGCAADACAWGALRRFQIAVCPAAFVQTTVVSPMNRYVPESLGFSALVAYLPSAAENVPSPAGAFPVGSPPKFLIRALPC